MNRVYQTIAKPKFISPVRCTSHNLSAMLVKQTVKASILHAGPGLCPYICLWTEREAADCSNLILHTEVTVVPILLIFLKTATRSLYDLQEAYLHLSKAPAEDNLLCTT